MVIFQDFPCHGNFPTKIPGLSRKRGNSENITKLFAKINNLKTLLLSPVRDCVCLSGAASQKQCDCVESVLKTTCTNSDKNHSQRTLTQATTFAITSLHYHINITDNCSQSKRKKDSYQKVQKEYQNSTAPDADVNRPPTLSPPLLPRVFLANRLNLVPAGTTVG